MSLFYIFGLVLLGGIFCKHESKILTSPVEINSVKFEKASGTGCNLSALSQRQDNCAIVKLSWPMVYKGNDTLKENVAKWANTYITSILTYENDTVPSDSISIQTAVEIFFHSHQKDLQWTAWIVELSDSILLNDGKHLTILIEGNAFTTGVHHLPTAAVATFDIPTGKRLSWDDFVTDKIALKKKMAKAFLAERSDLVKDGFHFRNAEPFDLPDNYGLTSNGIYCRYLVYEIGSYSMGETTFTLPFSELGTLSKVEK